MNVIIGQAHFIKTVEDLHEALAGVSPHLRFGLAFCEASGARLVRRSGNDDALIGLAVEDRARARGRTLLRHLPDRRLPGERPRPIKGVPEVCTILCATANPVAVIVAETETGRGIVGVVDGESPVGVETEDDVADRQRLLRQIGYKC